MQVQRPLQQAFPLPHEPRRVAVAPVDALRAYSRSNAVHSKSVPIEEVRVDMHVAVPHCGICGVAVRLNAVATKSGDRLCQECWCSRSNSWEDVRPASPMAGKLQVVDIIKTDSRSRMPQDRRVHPNGDKQRWTVIAGGESDPETTDDSNLCGSVQDVVDTSMQSFRTIEVLSCFRSEAARGLRLVVKIVTAERWHAWWAILLSLLLWPFLLTLATITGVGFLVLSTCTSAACVLVYPLAYINPRLYNFAMDS
ncbi:hypothetical protein PHYBOEH_001195 [Phytophthora boehmeriae]|uniref:Transmembrane protein n=1 Tax=Phytophthora boehmeriae TaxID=109152 RepID=A0A8T1WUL5_9STRA|nr:hypothetical protein PHYBOEH_001195 [Phytophthora boehmeriae]